jgi:hypothetical protein
MSRPLGTSAVTGFRETAAVLALFAMVLNLLAALMPLSGPLGFATAAEAALCQPGGGPDSDDKPGLPGPHHNSLCCFTHQVAGAALLPSTAAVARPVVVADRGHIAAAPPALAARLPSDSRPRAPPAA